MDIKYLGHSSFFIKGKTATVITDPFDSAMVGIKFPKNLESDIITVSHDHKDHSAVENINGEPFIVKGPGEYEIKNVAIIGYQSFHDDQGGSGRGLNIIYKIEIDNLSILHLGDLGQTLESDTVDLIGNVDILMIPVGGVYTINAATAKKLIDDIEPSIVIPMHFHTKNLNQNQFGQLAPLDNFLKEISDWTVLKVQKLTISKDKLPEEIQVVVFE